VAGWAAGMAALAAAGGLLRTPLQLPCGALLANRLCKSAATEGLADELGRATEAHVRLYRGWAESGCGLLITGNVMVDGRYVERPGNVSIDGAQDAERRARLSKYAAAAGSQGAQVWVQLSHPGRQAALLVAPIAPAPSEVPVASPIPLAEAREMTLAEVAELVQRFASAALVCKETGFSGVQIHAAHGYLLSAFLSPLANVREDRYGGRLERRAAVLIEVVAAVRAKVGPAFAVSVKLNSSDFQKGGFSHEDALEVARWLDAAGVDLIELSGGNYESPAMMIGGGGDGGGLQQPASASTARREAYFAHFAKDIAAAMRRAAVMVTGGFRTRAGMEQALAAGEAAVIGVVRPLCVDPRCTKALLDGLVDVLPMPELTLPVPGLAQRLASAHPAFALAGVGSRMLVFYDILLAWGQEPEGPQRRSATDASVLGALWRVQLHELRAARALKAHLPPLPSQDRDTLDSRWAATKRRLIALTLVAALLLRYYLVRRRAQ
jgi:2,4-dienoyl-CoA reductase-like NADH-dependent reductase (Old Yellow Enzyme family)